MIAEVDCEQGSPEWFRARMGIPTTSQFGRLVTPKAGKPSSQAFGYLCELLAEWMTDEPAESASSQFMQRGTALENKARLRYELEFDIDVRQVGFIQLGSDADLDLSPSDGEWLAGCSPDGLIGDDGGLEIKVPSAAKHVAYMLDPESLRAAYRMQVQGSLFVTGRAWWDLMSYSPCMPHVLVRCERDEKLIAALKEATTALHERKIETLIRWGYMEPPGAAAERPAATPMTVEEIFT